MQLQLLREQALMVHYEKKEYHGSKVWYNCTIIFICLNTNVLLKRQEISSIRRMSYTGNEACSELKNVTKAHVK